MNERFPCLACTGSGVTLTGCHALCDGSGPHCHDEYESSCDACDGTGEQRCTVCIEYAPAVKFEGEWQCATCAALAEKSLPSRGGNP